MIVFHFFREKSLKSLKSYKVVLKVYCYGGVSVNTQSILKRSDAILNSLNCINKQIFIRN